MGVEGPRICLHVRGAPGLAARCLQVLDECGVAFRSLSIMRKEGSRDWHEVSVDAWPGSAQSLQRAADLLKENMKSNEIAPSAADPAGGKLSGRT